MVLVESAVEIQPLVVPGWYTGMLSEALKYQEFCTLDAETDKIDLQAISFAWEPAGKMLKIRIEFYLCFEESERLQHKLKIRVEQFTEHGLVLIAEKSVDMISSELGVLECFAPQSGIFRIRPV